MNKETNNLLLWGIGLLFIIGIGVWMTVGGDDSNPNPSPYSASALTEVMDSFSTEGGPSSGWDFGTILMGDGVVSHEFEVVNNGTEPVKIGKVYTSCACTTAYVIDDSGKKYGKFGMPGHDGLRATADVEVQPGESVVVETVFDPAFHGPSAVGLADRSVYLETNSAKSPKLELKFTATVIR